MTGCLRLWLINMDEKKVAIIGFRGLSTIYSGFETLVRALIKHSNKKNYYYLFVRRGYDTYKKKSNLFKKIYIPCLKNKYFETPIYSFLSSLFCMFLKLDTVLILSTANCGVIWLLKLKKIKIVVNVDGLDWERKRWSVLGKLYLKYCKTMVLLCANEIITDSREVYRYYRSNNFYGRFHHITYGANLKFVSDKNTLKHYGISKNKYFVTVGRFVPENSLEDLIIAYKKLKTTIKCVIVGDSFYEDSYKRYLFDLAKANKNIIFTGFLKGDKYITVLGNAFCYVETKSIGGVHPSLLEAMSLGNCIIAIHSPCNIEVLGKNGIYYYNNNSKNGLAKRMLRLINNKNIKRGNRMSVDSIIQLKYSWDDVVKRYESLY